VAAFVVFDGLEPAPPTWDAWLDALGLQSILELVGVVTAVAEQPLRLGQIVEQCRTGVVADLSGGHEEAERPFASVTAWSFVFIPPWCDQSGARDPLFNPQARCRTVRLQIRSVDHDSLWVGISGSQALHHAEEHTHLTSPFSAIVERLVRAVIAGRITPAQPIVVRPVIGCDRL